MDNGMIHNIAEQFWILGMIRQALLAWYIMQYVTAITASYDMSCSSFLLSCGDIAFSLCAIKSVATSRVMCIGARGGRGCWVRVYRHTDTGINQGATDASITEPRLPSPAYGCYLAAGQSGLICALLAGLGWPGCSHKVPIAVCSNPIKKPTPYNPSN